MEDLPFHNQVPIFHKEKIHQEEDEQKQNLQGKNPKMNQEHLNNEEARLICKGN